MMRGLWANMDKGGFSPELGEDVLRFNGGLFENIEAIVLDADQLQLMINASEADWSAVEPAIFGTLLERALDKGERARLGAHYTPRAYVERLVLPTIVEPLRADWEAARAAAVELADSGDKAGAIAELRRFHANLCGVTILDPACGTGNFLYVALERLKRLEGEVLDLLTSLGEPRRSRVPDFRSTRTSSSASRQIRAPPQSPSWSCGSVTSNGIFGPEVMRSRPSRYCAISETLSFATRC
jgi:hypothetical protein